jgi:hypothetical protein
MYINQLWRVWSRNLATAFQNAFCVAGCSRRSRRLINDLSCLTLPVSTCISRMKWTEPPVLQRIDMDPSAISFTSEFLIYISID